MKKLLTIGVFGLLFASCDITKDAFKSKRDTGLKENIETKIFRPGDTVRLDVQRVHYRDTTIYTFNRQGTTLQTVYDKSGNVSDIACISSSIEEIRNEYREFRELQKDKEKHKTEDFDSSFILYIIGGVVLIFFIFMAALFFYFKNQQSAVLGVLQQLANK